MNLVIRVLDNVLNKIQDKYEEFKESEESEALKKAYSDYSSLFELLVPLVLSLSAVFLALKETFKQGKSESEEPSEDYHTKPEDDVIKSTLGGEDYIVTSEYGKQRSTHVHQGTDVILKNKTTRGAPLYSPITGKVIKTGNIKNGGNVVYIENDDFTVRLMHLQDINVKSGQSVTQGTKVGTIGSTGRSTGPHLHIEVLKKQGNISLDPVSVSNIEIYKVKDDKRLPEKSRLGVRAPNFETVVKYCASILDQSLLSDFKGNKLNIIAGILGNLIRESELDPRAYFASRRNRGAQGIAQWRGDRLDSYIKKWGKLPVHDPSLPHQIEFVCIEFKGKYNSVLQKLKENSNSLDLCVSIVNDSYEKSGESAMLRKQYAREVLNILRSFQRTKQVENSSSTSTTRMSVNREGYNRTWQK